MDFLRHSSPIKCSVFHFCFPAFKTPLIVILPIILHLMGRALRQRIIYSYGESKEIKKDLLERGIPEACIPWPLHGSYTLDRWHAWIAQRRVLEHQLYEGIA